MTSNWAQDLAMMEVLFSETDEESEDPFDALILGCIKPMAEQIEANRLAIKELQQQVADLDRRTYGMIRIGQTTHLTTRGIVKDSGRVTLD